MAFLQDPHASHQPPIRAPGAVIWLIVVLVAIYVVWALLPPAMEETIIENFAFYPIRYSPAFLAAHHVETGSLVQRLIPFVSYAFLHASIGHVGINCLWLLAFGPIVARRWGTTVFLTLFFVCTVAASVTHLFTNWGSLAPVVGASGAISGLMAAGIRLLWTQRTLDAFEERRPAPILSRPIMAFTVMWIGVNILVGLTGLGAGMDYRLIAWQAHIGGYMAGLLLTGSMDRWARLRQRKAMAAKSL